MLLSSGGAGLLGGMLIADAINDGQQEAYEEGFEDGAFFKILIYKQLQH